MCELGWTAFILGKVEPWPRAGIVIDTGKRKVKSKLRGKDRKGNCGGGAWKHASRKVTE